MLQARTDEVAEQRVRLRRFRLELRVTLNADEPGMVWQFDDLDEQTVRARSRESHPGGFKTRAVIVVHLVAVAVPLGDQFRSERAMRLRPRHEPALERAEPHRAADL